MASLTNLKQRFTVGTWNVRGFEPKKEQILEALNRKNVEICGFQETKRDKCDDFCLGYRVLLFDRANPHHGQGFALREELEVVDSGIITDRVLYKSKETGKMGNA